MENKKGIYLVIKTTYDFCMLTDPIVAFDNEGDAKKYADKENKNRSKTDFVHGEWMVEYEVEWVRLGTQE